MAIAIMQPYIFPYIGYFQLIYAADVFVFYDDVNFINRGWINRNRILLNGREQLITIPLQDASQNKLIKDIAVLPDTRNMQKLLGTITAAYAKAPYYKAVYLLIETTLLTAMDTTSETSIATLAINSILNICNYLGLQRNFKTSSENYDNRGLKKADRLIDICHREGINHYINASGGKEIYTKEYYAEEGVKLDFLNPELYEYPQFKKPFVPWLSIIDVLMFNSREEIVRDILPCYCLD